MNAPADHSIAGRPVRRILFALSLVALVAACASPGGSASRPAGAVAPERIGRDIAPDLTSIRFDALHTVVDLTVMVDPDGRPDMTTLRLAGTSNVALREAYREWIANSRFAPARTGGQPVRGEYRYRLQVGIPAPVI